MNDIRNDVFMMLMPPPVHSLPRPWLSPQRVKERASDECISAIHELFCDRCYWAARIYQKTKVKLAARLQIGS